MQTEGGPKGDVGHVMAIMEVVDKEAARIRSGVEEMDEAAREGDAKDGTTEQEMRVTRWS